MSDKHRGGKGGDAKHVRIYDAMQISPAWRALSGNAVKALLYVASFEAPKSTPNGSLFMSWGTLAKALGLNKKTAGSALRELVEKGFLRETMRGHFQQKGGPATSYRLTWRPVPGSSGPTNEWREWTPPENSNHGSNKRTRMGPKNGPVSDFEVATGVNIGPATTQERQKPVQGVGPFIGPQTIATVPAFSEPDQSTFPDTPFSGRPSIARTCEQCGDPFLLTRPDRAHPRKFCSERCRKAAERKRAAERKAAA